VTNIVGSSVTFSVTVAGSATLRYQWRQDGTPLFGETNSSLTLPSIANSDSGNYTVAVTHLVGSVTSAPAILVSVPPLITSQPVDLTVNQSQPASFSVSVSGQAPFSYQWQLNASNVNGATNRIFALAHAVSGDAGSYRVIVTNPLGVQTSQVAVLTVIVPPGLASQPLSRTNNAGTTATFTANITGSASAYKWFKGPSPLSDGGNISGSATTTLTISSVSDTDVAAYSLVVSNAAGFITSSSASLTVIDPPVITHQPTNLVALVGQTVSFNVAATGTAPAYQWYKGVTAIGGETAATLTLANVGTNNAGSYFVTVTNAAGALTSSTATLLVYTTTVPTLVISYTTNTATVTLTGVQGYNYAIQASTNLFQWTPVLTNASPFTLTETNADKIYSRYYRGIYLP